MPNKPPNKIYFLYRDFPEPEKMAKRHQNLREAILKDRQFMDSAIYHYITMIENGIQEIKMEYTFYT
jgi:hypothetical protein